MPWKRKDKASPPPPEVQQGRTSPLSPEIRQRIDDVAAGKSTKLSLFEFGSRALTEVPEEIRQLTGLRELELGIRIEKLPSWLADLPNLEQIDISEGHVAEFPTFLPGVSWSVTAEQVLDYTADLDPTAIYGIRIFSDLPDRIETPLQAIKHVFSLGTSGTLKLSEFTLAGGITRTKGPEYHKTQWASFEILDSQLDDFLDTQPELIQLTLFGFPARRVPEPTRRMRSLTRLDVTGLWPAMIPDWLFKTARLEWASLGFNYLADLPDSLKEAHDLEYLNLEYNRFSHIPACIWTLPSLTTLVLEGCPIEEIPVEILRLPQLSELTFDRWNVFNNKIATIPKELRVPPPEIAAQGLDAIRRYWQQERDAGVDYLAEAKLLIVGEPGAGKTSLAKKILDPDYQLDSDEESTEGIDVLPWQFPAGIRVRDSGGERIIERDFRVNIWDFGGQEIYHSTHQFFLTKRSVYVLVTDERKEDTDFEYWLEIVNLLSDGSPLLIAANCKQGRQHGVDLGALRRRYPNLRGTLEIDLGDNSGLDDAVRKIRGELEQLPHIGTALPATWRAVRVALEGDPRNYISAEEFFRVCEASGFTDRDDMLQLGGYLHDLGICLFFQDDALLSKTVILKPDWGTTAVYRVLDDPRVAQALGEFSQADLRRIWSDASYKSMHGELLQLMVRFQLCYEVPGAKTYIAPQLLTPSQPTYDWDESANLVLRYGYDVMPKGIVRRLIVALHDKIAPGAPLWRSGAVFEYEASKAEVIEVYRRRELTIRIRGGDPRVLRGLIDHQLGIIHRSYPGIKFEQYMPCDCPVCSASGDPAMFKVSDLEDFARTHDRIQCRRSRDLRDPVDLLKLLSADGLDLTRGTPDMEIAVKSPRPAPVRPEVFVSYKWGGDSEALVDEIQRRLTDRGVRVTRDKDELKYRDSIDAFMRRIGAGKCVVVILSKAYLESKYCMYELTQIAARREFASHVYPVVLPDAGISDALTRLDYIEYWESQRLALDAKLKKISQVRTTSIREELDLYATIRDTIDNIMDVMRDMNTLTPAMHRDTDFEQLYTQLAAALQI